MRRYFKNFLPGLKLAVTGLVKFMLILTSAFLLFFALTIVIGSLLQPDTSPKGGLKDFGVDISRGEVTASFDTHGGFLGDGLTFISAVFPDDYAENALSVDALTQSGRWSPLPLSRELSVLVYGDEKRNEGSHIVSGNGGAALIPGIENGCYCFIDRYKISGKRPEDRNILERYSQNFTLVIYDADTHTLYYAELDT